MNQIEDIRRPWFLSFSFGRALQNSSLKAWHGKDENVHAGQEALLGRAKANSEAQLGKYQGSTDKSANESLFEASYSY
jgi:fructose-bisphosphate aldolase class I